jgi:manganese transport protein
LKPEIQADSTAPKTSLPEVHSTVGTAQIALWRRMFAFAGPAYLISVGYMDPGNWATDLEGGARFGYALLWVIVMSNLMAILLQTLSARLGIVSRRDLAQACSETYPRFLSYALWVLSEIAIAACDLAEVLGAAIALNLLFHLPVLIGVIVTAADTLLILWFTRVGIRVIEAFVLALVATMTVCFLIELGLAHTSITQVFTGLAPTLNRESLYVAIGILGATVMPHNLYLHSALVQTRRIGDDDRSRRDACRFNLVDSAIALNGATIVNGAILALSATVFFERGIIVTEIQQAHQLLSPILGTAAASFIFAIALLCSGQSSTLTGTLAGQVVMEGFLNLRITPWLRRLITRTLAVVPAALTVYYAGDKGTYELLILSQVILSLQLPFAIIPLVHFTNDRQRMGTFANAVWVQVLSWMTTLLIIILNVWLVAQQLNDWFSTGKVSRIWLVVIVPVLFALSVVLVWITVEPLLPPWIRQLWRGRVELPESVPLAEFSPAPSYRRILLPLDHSSRDRDAVAHAAAMAKAHAARLYLLHVEEGVTSQMFGAISSTAEVESGRSYFERIADDLRAQGIDAELRVVHGNKPRAAIVQAGHDLDPDLIVMGAHGHNTLKDIVFGTTINAVRHQLKVPILVVRRDDRRH